MHPVVQDVLKKQLRRKPAPFKPGDTVRVLQKIKEGDKERQQAFEGVVIAMKGHGAGLRFTVRKISYGVGVEKTFYYHSPLIKEIRVVRSGRVRRAKLYYLRGKLSKKSARIEEGKRLEATAAESIEKEPLQETPKEGEAGEASQKESGQQPPDAAKQPEGAASASS